MKKRLLQVVLILAVVVLTVAFGCVVASSADEQKIYGDVNGDTEIRLSDLTQLRQYIADGVSVEEAPGADVDGNGTVDSQDLLLLCNYIANYNYDTQESSLPLGVYATAAGDNAYTTADAYTMTQYNGKQESDYRMACNYYERVGYELYSTNYVGESLSSVYVYDDAYRTVMFNKTLNELYVGKSDSGAESFPVDTSDYAEKNKTTVTQHYSANINGMCYFIKLADGSFIVIDGGYIEGSEFADDAKHAYETLCELNGSAEGIHIRAWLLTHSHGDHYQAFGYFAQNYSESITLDTLLYSPIAEGVTGHDKYLNSTVNTDVAKFEGAKTVYVHTGMSFEFVDVTLEILLAPEHVYKSGDPEDFNESSVVSRVKNNDGSMIFLADCGVNACDWMVDAYADGLKSDMVQVSHHGGETATAAIYDKIQASTLFWPCNESLLNSYRGELVKQHILEASYSKEHILHGYGNAIRELGYKTAISYLDVLLDTTSAFNTSSDAQNLTVNADGSITYTVRSGLFADDDPYVKFSLEGIDSSTYNAVKLVVSAPVNEDILTNNNTGHVYFNAGNGISGSTCKGFTRQGTSDDGKMTILVYLGDLDAYNGGISELRVDLGQQGETVTIYSVEMYYVDVD